MSEFESTEALTLISVISVILAKELSFWHDFYLLTEEDSNPYRTSCLT